MSASRTFPPKNREAEKRVKKAHETGATRLDLSGLGLIELPNSLRHLTTLRSLNLHHNRLASLPNFIGDLKDLEILKAYDNQLIELPESLQRLTSLKTLFVGRNRLKSLPSWLWNLTELESLSFWGNELTRIPEEIGRLSKLRFLNLSLNKLAELPESLLNLKKLHSLGLFGNDELGLPIELVGEMEGPGRKPIKPIDREVQVRYRTKPTNAQALLDYYFRLRLGKRPLNEAKLILLGRGEVGKTALVNRLVRDRFTRTSITKGIAITQWPITIDDNTIRLHVWDFGGQEIQHATHQFFLTERSLYLVVLNGRAGAEDEDAEYWLKFVKTFGASSPTIVVLNKIKIQPFNLNRTGLIEKYPFIRAFVETDCKPKTRNGRGELIKEIQAALSDMKSVRADFPAGWFQIKDQLSRMKKPFISFAEYRRICARLGEKDEQAQERLAGFLDDLGVALNFREDQQLCEETVLNPHWITEGVYKIITSKIVADHQGELKSSYLKAIFKGKRDYPPRMHDFLVQLMRKFELCFPYQGDPSDNRYLVPELLGKEKPALKDSFPPDECLNYRYDYRLMPHGLLPRFITRTHTMSDPSERWHTGVVLRWEGCRALVEADKQERQLLLRLVGNSDKRRRLLAVIRENFDEIHEELKEFRPTEWVAVDGHPEEWISHRELEIFEQSSLSTMAKTVGNEVVSVDVRKALDATDVPGARSRTQSEFARETRPLKLFISYAHEDEKWRAKLSPNLGLLVREGLVEVWSDLQITAGTKWDDEIKKRMEEADLYLFLMSTDLLNSDYVQRTELPIARKRHEEKKARLIPVVVRRCSWARYVGDIQGLPTGGRAIKEWGDKDEACFDVEEGLRETIDQLHRMFA